MALAFCAAGRSQVAPPGSQADREEIRRRQQQEQAEQRERLEQPRVELQSRAAAATPSAAATIPESPDGFLIERVILDTGAGRRRFPWLAAIASRYEGKRLGMAGMQHAIRALSNACIEHGHVTTRVLLPEQDIAGTRTLRLVVVPGTVGKISVLSAAAGDAAGHPAGAWKHGGTWRNAFPARAGGLLNIRDIEQGLEQMKRVPTQDVTMDLKPGAQPGESDVIVSRANRFPLRGHIGIDNSGDKNTGRWQGSATAFWDNPLLLNDLFSLTYNGAVATASGQGTLGNNITYSIPFGYWTAHASYNAYDYHQTVQGYTSDYESSGKSRGAELRVQFLARRDQNSKTTAQARVSHRRNRNYIDGIELEVQRRDTTTFEIALQHQRNMGPMLLDTSIAFRHGVPWFNATRDTPPRAKDAPTNRYHALTADATLRYPVALGPLRLAATSALCAQLTGDTLFGSEHFSIGGRYTVRGFDGRQTLGAEKGLTLRNDFSHALWRTGQSLYVALDGGHVTGPSSRYLSGGTLAGCALGLRGGWKSFYYDATVGRPLYKPAGLHTARATCTAQAGIQF
ncbi:MAG: ShlB/FhaC/HecB family hemolysin secretion/activation protein [Opitutaceae bacterium]|jgi:hemolysin activation/secretion protein|nr:ShlB/FhaC/HecB family hemolysin secretion/activation protein [Opitutaceae bacterium]